MTDQSHLDERYFVDTYVFNCPFCNRRHVAYGVLRHVRFDWTDDKPCHVYFVECFSCRKTSMHLAFEELDLFRAPGGHQRFEFEEGVDAGEYLDRVFFYSVPTSFFLLDNRVPSTLRDLLTEAYGCLKSNFLTGASACARKLVYEFAKLEGAAGTDYDERLKSLKTKHPEVEPEFFDTLLSIQKVTSSKVHENAYDGWNAKHLRLILAALSETLHEVYVLPALRADRRRAITDLTDELLPER